MTIRNVLLAAGSVVSLAAFLTVSPLMETEVKAQMFFGKVGPANGEPDGKAVQRHQRTQFLSAAVIEYFSEGIQRFLQG